MTRVSSLKCVCVCVEREEIYNRKKQPEQYIMKIETVDRVVTDSPHCVHRSMNSTNRSRNI